MATKPKNNEDTFKPLPDVLNNDIERKKSAEPIKKHQYKKKRGRRMSRKDTPIVRKQYDWAKKDDFEIKEEESEISSIDHFLQFNRIPTEKRNGVWQIRDDDAEARELRLAEQLLLDRVEEDSDESDETGGDNDVKDSDTMDTTSSTQDLNGKKSVKLVSLQTTERTETIRRNSGSHVRTPSARSRSQLVLKVQKNDGDESKLKKQIKRLADSTTFTVIMMILTLWALFGSDIGLICVPKHDDIILGSIMLAVLISFLFEMIILSIVHPNSYFLGFFFWMDFIAMISLVPDVAVVFDAEGSTDASAFTLARVGRMARVAVRTARLVRLVKVFELFFLYMERNRQKGDRLQWMDKDGDEEDGVSVADDTLVHDTKRINNNMERMIERSVLRETLLDSLFKKVFTMVLVFAVVLTFLDPAIVFDRTKQQAEASLKQAHAAYGNPSLFSTQVNFMKENKLIYLKIGTSIEVDTGTINNRRRGEKFEIDVPCNNDVCVAVYDFRDQSVESAWRSVILTWFTIIVLVAGSGSIHSTLRDLVIKPIERMVGVVKLLALKPLATLKLKEDFAYETGLVESMILKMGRLLQIGFGVAGAHIITSNLSSSGALVPIARGRRVRAVFLFVKIREIFDITDALQEDVLIFLNKVAQLVHAIAGQHGGFPYESSGLGTISLVFLLPPKREKYGKDEFQSMISKVHNSALKAALEIHAAIISPQFTRFMLKVPGIHSLGLNFALHSGWAIAGPVGSNLKVDASYVSPHVHEAYQILEHMSLYRFNLLMSGDFVKNLPEKMQELTCQVDHCVLLDTNQPIKLYCYDDLMTDEKITPPYDRLKLKALYSDLVGSYLEGDWPKAKDILERIVKDFPEFKPPLTLGEYMQKYNYKAPETWRGTRLWHEE